MSKYGALGVDIGKQGVEAFEGVVENLFPGAFCVVQRDPEHPRQGLVSHTDGAGSKPIQSYLHWRETGDAGWFKGLAQDVVAMNLDDIICVAARPLAFIDYITLNALAIDRVKLLSSMAEGFSECFRMLKGLGITIPFAGGETADHPDQLRTLDVSGSIFGRVDLERVVTGGKIESGDLIVGLRSGGQATYEKKLNSGMMCNGLTLARSCLMSDEYLKAYPELAHPGKRRYTGRFSYDDFLDDLGMTVGEALLSPTRIFAPVVVDIISKAGDSVHGMVHNTGGGLTKCLHLGRGIQYIKDSLPDPDPIFELIQRESGADWREMNQDFNMGVGFEIVADEEAVDEILATAERFSVGAGVIGRCLRTSTENKVTIENKRGKFVYS